MITKPTVSDIRATNWFLTIGGGIGLLFGMFVLIKSPHPIMYKCSDFLWSLCIFTMGIGGFLETKTPIISFKIVLISKLVAVLAISVSVWVYFHPLPTA